MNPQVSSRNLTFNVNTENVLMAAKSATNMEQTPRKVPFKDATNKSSELLKSAMKFLSSEYTPPSQISGQKQEMNLQNECAADDYDFEPFVFPPDNNCFCCGDKRKTDGEIWGEKLVLKEEFMEQLMSHFGPVNDFYMDSPSPPNSPYKLRPITIKDDPQMSPNHSLDNSSYKSAVEFPGLDDSDSEMEVPDFDMNFSFEVDVNDSADGESSIIQDW